MAKLIDCYSPLTPEETGALKDLGYSGVCRYLGAKTQGWGKGLQPVEVQAICSADLSIVSIWEGNPTQAAYFTAEQGKRDATFAIEEARWVGQPKGTAIYFTVDFDATPWDLGAIITYFEAVRATLDRQYAVGVYGGIRVVEALYASRVKPDYYWQTLAWSDGAIFPYAHLYQSAVGQSVGGISVDLDTAYKEPGWWPQREVGDLLQYGDHGEPVRQLQADLNTALGTHIAQDGVYGAATDAAVKSFQVIHRIAVTGIASAETLAVLHDVLVQQSQAVAVHAEQTQADKIARVVALLDQAQALVKSL